MAHHDHAQAGHSPSGPGHHHDSGHQHDHGHQHGNVHQHGHGDDDGAMAELVDLDAEVLSGYLDEVMDLIFAAVTGPVRRIVDLGCGTGTGALALLRRFDGAEVVAVDAAETMLARVRAKTAALGVPDAIRTVHADLDQAWPVPGPVDLVWAKASLHHLADPDRVLADVFGTLRPDGLFAVAELNSFPRFLTGDLGTGLEERCHAALAEAHARDLPHLDDDWGVRLRRAGFTVEQDRTFTIDLTDPLPAATGRYAEASLRRARSMLDGRVSGADLAALDALLDGDGPQSITDRAELRVRATRSLLLARRP